MLINYKFQVDKVNDMIIGGDILHELGIDLPFSKERIRWGNPHNPFDYNSIPMKTLGILSEDITRCTIYDLHTPNPILQEEEEEEEEDRQTKILGADYSKVDIDDMVNGLNIAKASKTKLKQTLKKFLTLFGEGLGILDILRPFDIEIQPGSKPYDGWYYNIPKAY